jgi:hypothetical protein
MEASAAPGSSSLTSVISTMGRLLTFRATREELINLNVNHLLVGLACTWIVGIGRYWDNPRVGLLQHLGVGSVVYVFALALLLWLVIWPIRPQNWTYFRVLTFVTLVSPPAILYAIPIQYFASIDTANGVNSVFLAIVSFWRVALLMFFLRRVGGLGLASALIAMLLPITMIIVVLTILNLERVVFNFMGGFVDPSPNDGPYIVLVFLTYIAVLLFIPLLLSYFAVCAHRWRKRRISELMAQRKDD